MRGRIGRGGTARDPDVRPSSKAWPAEVVISMLMGALVGVALNLGAALWVLVLIMFVCCLVVFIRHFDEIMEP